LLGSASFRAEDSLDFSVTLLIGKKKLVNEAAGIMTAFVVTVAEPFYCEIVQFLR
jgi:hypothetical protein